MKYPKSLHLYLSRFASEVTHLKRLLHREETRTALELFRPSLHTVPLPTRRYMEVLVAGTALFLLLALGAIATGNLVILVLCSGLAYTIISQVFGLDIELGLPRV